MSAEVEAAVKGKRNGVEKLFWRCAAEIFWRCILLEDFLYLIGLWSKILAESEKFR